MSTPPDDVTQNFAAGPTKPGPGPAVTAPLRPSAEAIDPLPPVEPDDEVET